MIRVCQRWAVRGGRRRRADGAALPAARASAPGETTADGAVTLEAVRCLGLCDRAPAALVNRRALRARRPVDDAARRPPAPARLRIGGLVKVALANVGIVDPASLADYRAQGGMAALRKALGEMTPGAGHRRGQGQQAAGPRRRGVLGRPEVGVRRSTTRRRATSSATPTRASRARSRTGC